MIPLGGGQLDDAGAGVVELSCPVHDAGDTHWSTLCSCPPDAELTRQALQQLAQHALPVDAPGAWVRAAVTAELAVAPGACVDVDQVELPAATPSPTSFALGVDENTNRRQLDPDDV